MKRTELHLTCDRSADNYFHGAVAELLLAFVPIKAAYKLIMGVCQCTALGVCKLHDPKSLMLHWHSIITLLMLHWSSVLGYSSNAVRGNFAKKGGGYFDSGLTSLYSRRIFYDARPIIVELPLILIFWTWYRCCRDHFCLESWLIVQPQVKCATPPLGLTWCNGKICWHSSDAHF